MYVISRRKSACLMFTRMLVCCYYSRSVSRVGLTCDEYGRRRKTERAVCDEINGETDGGELRVRTEGGGEVASSSPTESYEFLTFFHFFFFFELLWCTITHCIWSTKGKCKICENNTLSLGLEHYYSYNIYWHQSIFFAYNMHIFNYI